jgi:uncharacterized tellurite resistance protein B-like protein
LWICLELNKKASQGIPIEDFKSGVWFIKLLRLALQNYREKVNAEYFRSKYPNLPPDAIVDRRIDLAKKYAAAEGGATAAAYTAAIVTTIGSEGAASPLTIPAAAAIAIDLSYTSNLQLRLAYDLSVLYGKPLDFEDPEDLKDLLTIAFGIKVCESFQQGLQKLCPEVTRVAVKKVITGDTLKWLKALPVVGRLLLQRNIIKMAVPAIGICLGTGFNYFFTGSVGKRAKDLFRSRAAFEEASNEHTFDDLENLLLFLQTIWLVIRADGKIKETETRYMKNLVGNLQKIDGSEKVIKDFASRINYSDKKILQELSSIAISVRKEIYKATCVAAIVDGHLSKREAELLNNLADICDCVFDEKEVIKLSKQSK